MLTGFLVKGAVDYIVAIDVADVYPAFADVAAENVLDWVVEMHQMLEVVVAHFLVIQVADFVVGEQCCDEIAHCVNC